MRIKPLTPDNLLMSCFGETIEAYDMESFNKIVQKVITSLTPREESILRLRFGLFGEKYHTLREIGKTFDLSPERIRQIEYKALRKLRHPSRANRLKALFIKD